MTMVLDVGGGTGTLISSLLNANPHLTGVILERQVVVADARAASAERGLAARCEVVAGDFFQSVPAVEADVVIPSHVIHDWDDAHAATILRNTRAAMRQGDRLLVAEAIVPPGNEPHPSKQMDVTMLLWGDGRERTLEEYRDLLDSAGLRLNRVMSLPANPLGFSLIGSVIVG